MALSSGNVALHLAVEALGLRAGTGVLVPTMTFAATTEVVRYLGATPILVDCHTDTLNLDPADVDRKVADLRAGRLPVPLTGDADVEGILPVHVGGWMVSSDAMATTADRHGVWVVEDAAHAFLSAWSSREQEPWRRCGANTAQVTAFSLYANKPTTTGEGGVAVTDDDQLADRMRMMSLHGLSQNAWQRYGAEHCDYRIIAPGYKYNLTDIAAAIGIHQVRHGEELRRQREAIAQRYFETLGGLDEVELPVRPTSSRRHSWHLFPIRLRLDRLTIDRNQFIQELRERGIGSSVHWRPLHLHPYYQETFGWRPDHFPVATREWERLISLPLYPSMDFDACDRVSSTLRNIAKRCRR